MSGGYIAAPSVTNAIELATSLGADAKALWRAAGLDPSHSHGPETRVDKQRLYAVFALIMRQLQAPDFPIRYGRRISVDSYDALGLVVKTARDVREAFERTARYHRFWTNTSRWLLHEEPNRLRIEFARSGRRELGMRVANEAAIAEMVSSIRALVGATWAPLRICLLHKAPDWTRAHTEFFGCPVRFEEDMDAVEVPREFLGFKLPHADEALSAFLKRYLDERLAGDELAAGALEGKLRELVAIALPNGAPRMGEVARELGMSERTLTRRLADSQQTFQSLVDATRTRMAIRLLRTHDRPLAEVAFMLGFSETSAFSRAFKRWTGKSPAKFRANPLH